MQVLGDNSSDPGIEVSVSSDVGRRVEFHAGEWIDYGGWARIRTTLEELLVVIDVFIGDEAPSIEWLKLQVFVPSPCEVVSNYSIVNFSTPMTNECAAENEVLRNENTNLTNKNEMLTNENTNLTSQYQKLIEDTTKNAKLVKDEKIIIFVVFGTLLLIGALIIVVLVLVVLLVCMICKIRSAKPMRNGPNGPGVENFDFMYHQ